MATRPYFDVRTLEGFELTFESEPLASGGEKVIFMGKERQHVIGFFHGHLNDRLERKRRLEKILGPFNPTRDGGQAGYWKAHFCWPVAIVDSRGVKVSDEFMRRHNLVEPILGVITPAYRPNFFFRDRTGSVREKKGRWFTGAKARRLLPDNEKGDLRKYLQVCAIMSSAVRRLHFAGLAHSDLSHSNVLIDPKNGDACVIDIDSLVVPGIAPPSVLGTPGYIAPEVLAGKKLPSIETDQHALAVLIYESLLLRHPLQGPKIHSGRSAEEDESIAMGKGALFVEHPTDHSNRPNPSPTPPVSALGPHLARLFHKTFVDGLHHPSARATASEWEKASFKTLDLVHPSPSGQYWFPLERGSPMICPFTRQRLTAPVPFAEFYRAKDEGAYTDDQSSLTIWHNMPIYKRHIFSNLSPIDDDGAPQGYFSNHEGKWYLVNQSGGPMCALDVGYLPHEKAVEIKSGTRILLSMEPHGRLAVFDFMNP
jgi:hypothetical protein